MILTIILIFIKIVIVFSVVMGLVAYIPYVERKLIGDMQRRIGPSVVGPFGIFQPIADGLKLLFKEEVIPLKADKLLFVLSPVIVVCAALLGICVIPWGDYFLVDCLGKPIISLGYIANINVSLLFIIAVSSLGVYGIVFSGWSSNSKYSLLGGIRATSQLISYEITGSVVILTVALSAKSLSLVEIVNYQKSSVWLIIPQIIGFIIFLICGFAETNRIPFDLPEAESELVSGYHTEYSSMKFAMFYMGEYAHILVFSCLIVVVFLGGWLPPFNIFPFNLIPGTLWFGLKVSIFVLLFIWVRATLPRVRFDQLMNLNWKILLPVAFANFLISAILVIAF
ncbi:MAG: NADH-quinone oxidoreductase subunit NuoH [Candidatus Hydrogenedentota bacterium]